MGQNGDGEMPDPADPAPTPDPAPNPAPAPAPAPSADDNAALKAALKKANEEAATFRHKLKELEDRDKSDSEKLAERAAAAEKRAAEAEANALRLEVAAEKGLTKSQVKRLVGATREELEADADELLADFAPRSTDHESPPPPGGRPKERLRGGSDPTEEPEETDPRKLADLIPRR
jgi:hypothetical protein